MPVYNEWEAFLLLLTQLDAALNGSEHSVSVLIVDDGSTEPAPPLPTPLTVLQSIDILRLRRNVGHQRAIALGLTYISCSRPSVRVVVVMDADGEDAPEHVPLLLAECRRQGLASVIFARRTRRTEGVAFQLGYSAFRLLHRILTGHRVEVGTFSAIPASIVRRLVAVPELWNHYAAAIYRARLPWRGLPLPRGARLAGVSKMNLTSLVTHGLSAISVFGETVGVRLLCTLVVLVALTVVALGAVLATSLFTQLPIPGWATSAAGIMIVILINLLIMALGFVLFILQARANGDFLPLRDWQYFVEGCEPYVVPQLSRY